jgi:hypothetical protein
MVSCGPIKKNWNEFPLCKHEMVCLTMGKYNNPPISTMGKLE